MKMRKMLSLVLAVLMLAAILAGCSSSGTEAKNVVKLGVFEPASGDNGAGGKQETLGIQYANQETPTVTIGGVEYTVELDIVDNESSNDKAASAASKLVSDGCAMVVGSYGSGVSIAASPTFEQAGIPAMGITCTNPQVTEGNSHYFRICFLDPFQGTVLANFASSNFSATKAYCLAKLGDDYSVGLCNYFIEAFEALGGEVVYETFPDGNSDFTSYVANAANAGAQVFFAPVSTEAASLIIDQVSAQGLEMPLLAGDTWDSNVILNAASGKAVDVYVTTFYQEGGNAKFDEGVKAWINADATAKTNNGGDDTIAAVTAMGYDAYYVALEAMKKADSIEPAKIMEALPTVSYTGVSGLIEFGENGDANRDTAFVKHANTETGAWDFVAEQGVN